jgi:hypothetical protein
MITNVQRMRLFVLLALVLLVMSAKCGDTHRNHAGE